MYIHTHTGNYQQALHCYKQIHKQFPENLDCLRFIVRLCSDLGLKETQQYSLELRRAEKATKNKQQRELSGSSGEYSGGSKESRYFGSSSALSSTGGKIHRSSGSIKQRESGGLGWW